MKRIVSFFCLLVLSSLACRVLPPAQPTQPVPEPGTALLLPSSTPLPLQPPSLPQPTQLPIPTTVLSSEVFSDLTVFWKDDFSPMDPNWEQLGDEYSTMDNVDGKLVLEIQDTPSYLIFTLSHRTNIEDLILQTTVQTTAETNQHGMLGFICRAQDLQNFYALLAVNSDKALILKYKDGSVTKLYDGPSLAGPLKNGTNTLGAACVSSTLALYVNGEVAAIGSDSDFKEGDVGPFLATTDTGYARADFDDFSVLLPEGEGASSDSEIEEGPGLKGVVVYRESFDDMPNNWDMSTIQEIDAFFAGGLFNIGINTPNTYFASTSHQTNLSRTGVEVLAGLVNGPRLNLHGVICRAQDNQNFYGLGISNDGLAAIFKASEGELINLEQTNIGAFDPEANRIFGLCIDDQLSLFLNDEEVLTAYDSDYELGDTGVFVVAMTEAPVLISFEDFIAAEMD